MQRILYKKHLCDSQLTAFLIQVSSKYISNSFAFLVFW